MSGGRLITGRGTGWSPEEYLGVGLPWQERGARPDECLDVLESVWTTEPVARHEGRHHTFPAAHIGPKPLQRPPGHRSTCPASPPPPDAGWPAARTAYFPSRCPSGVPHRPRHRVNRAGDRGHHLRTGDETDVDHVFVDFVHLADRGADQTLELLRQTM
ncbi:LLM class flavin-dependent oxidoreductase [Streptomyces tendae]|uniref:LLM class flavin-dependent oxidoreductase n=1 Tax=Streptomyces tendae TaxID=1932 RepID=UPI003415058B